jgi:hypothetical protein
MLRILPGRLEQAQWIGYRGTLVNLHPHARDERPQSFSAVPGRLANILVLPYINSGATPLLKRPSPLQSTRGGGVGGRLILSTQHAAQHDDRKPLGHVLQFRCATGH